MADRPRSGERRPAVARAILDTSVVIDLEQLDPALLAVEIAVTSITVAELSAGPHATSDPDERARRQDRLQRVEAAFDPLPFDVSAARAYGLVYAAVTASGRKVRGARMADLLIAAVARSAGLPLITRNPDDLAGLDDLVTVIAV